MWSSTREGFGGWEHWAQGLSCRKIRHRVLHRCRSTAFHKQDLAGTGLRIYSLFVSSPNFLTWLLLPSQVTRDGWNNQERDCQMELNKHPSQHCYHWCSSWNHPSGSPPVREELRDCLLVQPVLVLLIFPSYSMSQGKQGGDLAVCTAQVHWHPPGLVTKHSCQVHITAHACLITVMTTTLKAE